jgi:uncharacterized protein (TIGR02646 family)
MIKVQRIRRDNNGNLIQPSPNWFAKSIALRAQLITEYLNGNRKFNFTNHYSDREAQNALEKLFEYKCCYCERLIEDREFDVEHFRPKGIPIECKPSNPPHYGYFWLVYDWNNLYLSCRNCNRTRKDINGWEINGNNRTSGKLNSFRLFNPHQRAVDNNYNILNEQPFLLDPCNDDPEMHITFDITGNPLPIGGCQRAKETIEIIGLDRGYLNHFRQGTIRRALDHIKHAIDANLRGDTHAYNREIQLYLELAHSSSKYAGAVRKVVIDPALFGLLNESTQYPAIFLHIKNLI